MRVSVSSIAAKCPRCGSDDFEPSNGAALPLPSDAMMRCLGCGGATSYVELTVQIAERARAHSAALLDEIRRNRGK